MKSINFLSRCELAFRRLLPFWSCPLNSAALVLHCLVVGFSAASLAFLSGLEAISEPVKCYSQRTQEPLTTEWKLELCLQYAGNKYGGVRHVPVAYSTFPYYICMTVVFNAIPIVVRSSLEHRLLQKFLRRCREGDAGSRALEYAASYVGIHSGMRLHKATVSFVSSLVAGANLVLLLLVSHGTFLSTGNYPYAQYLGNFLSNFGLVFPGTGQCEIQPKMGMGLHTETFGCLFPLAQHYRHILIIQAALMVLLAVWSVGTFVKDVVYVFLGGSTDLVHTAMRDLGLERRIRAQWTTDELDTLNVVRKRATVDQFLAALNQLDMYSPPDSVTVG